VKATYFKTLIYLSLIFTFVSTVSHAQETGKIAGKVSDKKTGETLIGLTVKLAGTNLGVSTNIDGKYILGGLKPGKYTLSFSYVGYPTKQITEVEVSSGKVTNLDVLMEETSIQNLKEVVITASAKQESNNSLYAQQKSSTRISDGISAESIRKSPDKNTAEVLKRVSGTTIQDNKFVIVRGLSDRYNTASLDNGALPSTEPNRKAFSFDIVPSNMIDNIVISKTATPDMSGDFAGGAVQILTKDIPDQNFISYGFGFSYNSQSTFKDFESNEKSLVDYLGFNTSFNIPSTFPSTSKVINKQLTTAQQIAAINSLSNNFDVYKTTALPGQNYQFSIGRVKDFEKSGNRFGAILSLTYRNSQITNPDINKELFDQFNYTDRTYKFSTNVGGLMNLSYVYGNSKITFKNIFNRIQDDQYLNRRGINNNTSTLNKFYAFDFMQKTLLKSTLDGEHKLGESKAKLKWTLAFSNVGNNKPDERKISYYLNQSDANDPTKTYAANITSIGKENTRLFSKLTENIYSSDVNLSFPLSKEGNKGQFKTGLSATYRDREFNVRFIGLLNQTASDEVRYRPLSKLFGADLINAGYYSLDEIGNSADRYFSNSLVSAGYAMLDNKLSEKLRIVWGIRAEQFNLNLETYDPTQPVVTRNQLDILPSANFTYSITEKSNFRASYYRTVARPEFRELSPFAYYDYEQLAIQFGNPNLKRTVIQNADLRYEIYPQPGQIISLSVFYKKFRNAIETTFYDVNSTPDISYSNAANANTYGAELEFRRNLGSLVDNPLFQNSTIYTNLSFIHSRVNFSADQNPLAIGRPLIGQSPYVINAGLQHSILKNKLAFNLLYNRVGRRIYRVGGVVYPNVWEQPRDVVDFQTSFRVIKGKAEIKLNISDILNQRSIFYFDRNEDKKYTSVSDDAIVNTRLGTNASLSFNYSF
jgi:TonB-dependent receptor